jgi:hypothetical protein
MQPNFCVPRILPRIRLPCGFHEASYTLHLTARQEQTMSRSSQLTQLSSSRRHIPYLPFHKSIIREICRPQKDDLLILGKGLGMRRVSYEAKRTTLAESSRSFVLSSRHMTGRKISSSL